MTDLAETRHPSQTWRIRPSDPAQARGRKRELLAEQEHDWQAGHPAPPEDYLARWPTDPKADPDAASLLVAEFFERRERGDRPSLSDYEDRFPEHAPALAEMIRRQEVVRTIGGKRKREELLLRLPDAGEELFGFRLRQPLGRGAFARVFLAEQPDLAGRPVVLKISANEGTEPQTLARLQHTNIVPIYSVHEDARAGLRAVCMPYFGGASLSSVLARVWAEASMPTRGAELVAALEAVGAPAPEALAITAASCDGADPCASRSPQTPLGALRGMTYVQAVAWIVAELADGLHHAHQRGVLHRDVKPSNILLDAEGQPLLLDFNVSLDAASDAAHAVLGGTVAYAAPEHIGALIARTPESFLRVDRRSDVYSLGLILTEMLTGQRPFEQGGSYSVLPTQLEAMAVERGKGAPSLRQSRKDVPWSLESIARRCLAPEPERRYQQADQLAEDLRRFLDDRPLKYAPELSRVEQAQKLVRRHPRLATSGSVCLAAAITIVGIGSALVAVRGHLADTRTRLNHARARERRQAHDAGVQRALCLVNTTLGTSNQLKQGAAVCEQTLALYGLPGQDTGETHPDWTGLPRDAQLRLAEDRRELLLLLAGARVRMAPGDRATLRKALNLLEQAESIRGLGPSKALWLDRASYLRQLGDDDRASRAAQTGERIHAASARDHYLLAISHARQGGESGYRRAIAELDAALRLNPRHYWSVIQRGICHMELGENLLAAADFGTCTGLWPEHPWGYFNRGYVFERSGRKADAVRDYSAALDRDRTFVAALVNRGLARLELKAFAEALDDFKQALVLGHNDAAVHAGRAIALEGSGRHAEADAAFREAFRLAASEPEAARDRLHWTYGFAVALRLPDAARDAFDHVLDRDSRHPQALYGRAMLAMQAGQGDAARALFDRALDADPRFNEARRYRAVLSARRGDWDRASRDINLCLEREPGSGDTLYAAACVAARAAAATADRAASDQALDLLRRALSLGSGGKALDDPDLSSLRYDPRFAQLVSAYHVSDASNRNPVSAHPHDNR